MRAALGPAAPVGLPTTPDGPGASSAAPAAEPWAVALRSRKTGFEGVKGDGVRGKEVENDGGRSAEPIWEDDAVSAAGRGADAPPGACVVVARTVMVTPWLRCST